MSAISNSKTNPRLGVVDLGPGGYVGGCAVCFSPGPMRYVWRSAANRTRKGEPRPNDVGLCDEHAKERKHL